MGQPPLPTLTALAMFTPPNQAEPTSKVFFRHVRVSAAHRATSMCQPDRQMYSSLLDRTVSSVMTAPAQCQHRLKHSTHGARPLPQVASPSESFSATEDPDPEPMLASQPDNSDVTSPAGRGAKLRPIAGALGSLLDRMSAC